MYKNNFGEVFDEIYGTSEIKRFALPFRRFSDNAQTAYYHFLADVLNNCFDEEITVSDGCMDRYEYEKSSPECRYENFNGAYFSSCDLGLSIMTNCAEIKVFDVLISEPDMNNDPESVFDNSSSTVMIFAAAYFPDRPVTLDSVKMAAFLCKRPEKIYVSEYEDTLYVEIDYKKLSADRMSKGYVRRACLSACDYISLILDIVKQI